MNRRLNSCVASGIFALLAGSWSASLWAEHVILEPGWIAGQADVATEGQIVQSLSVNAYGTGEGSGHRASKSISQSYTTGNLVPLDYSLTVQGGTLDDQGETWDYRVRATATARTDPAFCPDHAPNCRYAYTNIYFSDRYFPVAIDQTVTNNYAADAAIRFQLDITDNSDPSLDNQITAWRAYGYAYKNMPAGEEGANSRSYTHSSYTPCESHTNESPCGAWDMPVVGNTAVRVYASITVYGNALREDGTRYNYSKSYTILPADGDYLYIDVGTDENNQVVDVPLSVTHEAPPPVVVPPYEYGAVEGTINLNLVFDGIDYSEQLFTYPTWPYSRHRVYGWGSNYIYTNPGDFLLNNERTGTRNYRVLSYLYDEEHSQILYWPYTGGDYTNDLVTVVEGQIARKDFINETGILNGQLLFNGSLKTKDLDWYQIRAYGARYYEPSQGWINQPTYGGDSYETIYIDPTAPDKSYRMFLIPGQWQPYYIRARANNTDLLGYSGWSEITLYDYSHYYDGNYYDFGQPVDIIGGDSKQQNFHYNKIGGVSMCFEAVEHSLNLRDPYVYGSAYFDNQDGKREMQVNVTGWSNTDLMPDPEAILYGPEGIYNLTPRAYTEDGTYITFPSREVTLSQKVFKKRCLTSADIVIENYDFNLTTDVGTDTATAEVTGSAADDDGILRIEFWLDGVQVHVIDYSATAELLLLAQTDVTAGLLQTSVDFSYDFDLTAGLHTVRVVAVDGLGNESYDEWEIEVNTAPVANDDSLETLEDNPLTITVATLLANDSDADGDTLAIESLPASTHGTVEANENGTLTYTPSPDYWGTGSFIYTISDGRGGTAEATVTIAIMPVNDGPPVASTDSYETNEDVTLDIAALGVLANDTDIDGDTLSASLKTAPAHGTVVVNSDGSFSYMPETDYFGLDSFIYQASDGMGGTGSGTVDITINAVNDPPQVLVDTASQSMQYSDAIVPVTISAEDIDSAPSALVATWTDLPDGLSISGGCAASSGGSNCSWTLEGNALVSAGTYAITFTLSDGEFAQTANTELIVELEDATAIFDDSNPVSVRVAPAPDDGVSGLFSLAVHVHELDESVGDLSNAIVSMSLVPVGPGSSTNGACTSTSTDGQANCDFNGVSVNTYLVMVTIDGNYYTGSAEDVLTVYDPSLGFTTGGGWFYWPGTGEKTNFGYTMKYGKKGTNVKGSLLLIRHLANGQKYRIKSNALSGLALGMAEDETEQPPEPYGWASFSGKSTYLDPAMEEPEGNHGFTVYVEDRNEPGGGEDRFWITTRAKDGTVIPAMSLFEPAPKNTVSIQGGNIVAPH